MALKMVKKGKSCKWKTKSNPTKPLKNELTSKRSPLLYKSGRFTPHSGQQEYQTRNIQTGTKLFEWKIQPSCFLCLPLSAARTGTQEETFSALQRLKWNFLGNTESHSQSQGNGEPFFPPSLLCSLLFPISFFFFSLQLFWSEYHSDFITVTSSLWTRLSLGGREPLWRW